MRHIKYGAGIKLNLISALLVGVSFMLASCESGTTSEMNGIPHPIDVDPIFREFYTQLGGIDVLGQAISQLQVINGIPYQYTESALMVADPQQTNGLRRHLAPIGLDMGVAEPAVPPPERPDVRYVEGHIIYAPFVGLYEHLGGIRIAGPPISEVHYNPLLKRHEQYFANIGMYILDDDPDGEVHLLAYGPWKCDLTCRQLAPSNAIVNAPHRIGIQFVAAVSRLGAYFPGYALTDVYPLSNGYLEQVFENIVLVADPNLPSRVFLRPISQAIGILPDPLAEPIDDSDYIFVPIQGDNRGYNVLRRFMEYIALHGGEEAAGPPISEVVLQGENIYRQCFTNLCLEEERNASGTGSIRPAQLGYAYVQIANSQVMFTPDPEQAPENDTPAETPLQVVPEALPQELSVEIVPTVEIFPAVDGSREIIIQVWENLPMVTPAQSQEIGVMVLENNAPVKGIEPDLVLSLPDGRQTTYYMYATGEDGQTIMKINPLDVPGNTVIPYQVCIFYPGGQRFCVKDSFIVWDNP